MKASIGDRIIVASNTLGRPVRDGRIVEVRDGMGQPPYDVLWSDTGRTSLFFPGVDTQIQHFDGEPTDPPHATADRAKTDPRHVKTWRVRLDLFESGDETTAHAVLSSDVTEALDAHGEAHRSPQDPGAPQIGDEVAVARALRVLADRLLELASIDLEATTHVPVSLRQ
jgi:Domain of unknown function (DUF1876)/Domain of unknown function (DUF1918)